MLGFSPLAGKAPRTKLHYRVLRPTVLILDVICGELSVP